MNGSTQLNLSVDGQYQGSMICPRIEDIKSIDYDYNTHCSLTRVSLNCESQVHDLDKLLGSIIPNVPRNSKEVKVRLNYPKSVASHC